MMMKSDRETNPEICFFDDDGEIPNSRLPLIIYHKISKAKGERLAEEFEETFKNNNWTNSWRWGVYDFHHYHSNTHEVLGVFQGNANLLLGGEKGERFSVEVGDVIIIPAGVGHKCLSHSLDFTVVGAYPDGLSADINKGEIGERPYADHNINKVPIPNSDPIFGKEGGLLNIWKDS